MKQLTKKRILSLILALCICISFIFSSCGKDNNSSGSSSNSPSINASGTLGETPDKQLGLYVENGVVMLGGKPFYGIGTNYHDIAFRYITDPIADDFEKGLKNLADYKIPYVRVRFSSYGGEGMDLFKENKDLFFRGMDKCVELCEKYKIGIIAVLAWTTTPYRTGTESDTDFLTTVDSEGFQLMVEYMKAIINRYKNSPAIWGWEVGNEYNLACNIPPNNLDPNALSSFYDYISKIIRETDGSGRTINTGNSQNRFASKHLMDAGSWEADSKEDMKYMLEMYNSENMSITSTHVYNTTQGVAGKQVSISEYLKMMTDFCKEMGKPLYIGEYCDDEKIITEEESLAKFQKLHDAILENDIQLATIWSYNNYTDNYARLPDYVKYMLNEGKKANEKFTSDGKQDIDSYWNSTKNVVYAG